MMSSNKRQKISTSTYTNVNTFRHIQNISNSNIKSYVHTFSLCKTSTTNGFSIDDVSREDTRRKLTILCSHCPSHVETVNELFQNENTANTVFFKIICDTYKQTVDKYFVDGPDYEFKINEFNEDKFLFELFYKGMPKLTTWFNIVVNQYMFTASSRKEVIREFFKNELCTNEITAINAFVKFIGNIMFSIGKLFTFEKLVYTIEKINTQTNGLESKRIVATDDVKKFICECGTPSRPLIAWTEKSRYGGMITEFVFKYDSNNEFKELIFCPFTRTFTIGDTLEKTITVINPTHESTNGVNNRNMITID